MIITPSVSPFNTAFRNQRFGVCNSTVNVGFAKLPSDCFCGNRVLKVSIECHLCCSSSVTFRHNPLQCTAIRYTFEFRPLLLLADDVLPRQVSHFAVLPYELLKITIYTALKLSLRPAQSSFSIILSITCTLSRSRCGRGNGPVVRQTTK